MKQTLTRRIRRRTASHEGIFTRKESQQEQSFFGGQGQETFFQPAAVIQRKCVDCEKEEKKVHRQPEKKEEEKKIQRTADKREEDKVMKMGEKNEEEKVMKMGDKTEEKKVMKAEDKKEEEKVQKKDAGVSSVPSNNASNYIGSLNGKGKALASSTNYFFSSRMGYDFSNVKVHTDKEAAQSAKGVNAKAYTIGNNVVFNEGQYNTESSEGKKLLAHELAHVVQQDNFSLFRKPDSKTSQEPDEIGFSVKWNFNSFLEDVEDELRGTMHTKFSNEGDYNRFAKKVTARQMPLKLPSRPGRSRSTRGG